MDANQRSSINNQTNNVANEKWTPGAKGKTADEGPLDHTYPNGLGVQQQGNQGLDTMGTQQTGAGPGASGWLVLLLTLALGGLGFADDYIKISKQRSLGLRSHEKLIGQTAVAVLWGKADASAGDAPAVAVVRGPAIVNRHDLVFAGTPSEAEIAAAHTALLAAGILVR